MFKKSFSILSIVIISLILFSVGLLAISPSDINEDLKVDPDKISELDKVYVEK